MGAAVRPQEAAWEGRLTLVEPMGNHRIVWIEHQGAQIASIDQDKTPLATEAGVPFSLDGAQVSLFDEGTGARI